MRKIKKIKYKFKNIPDLEVFMEKKRIAKGKMIKMMLDYYSKLKMEKINDN